MRSCPLCRHEAVVTSGSRVRVCVRAAEINQTFQLSS